MTTHRDVAGIVAALYGNIPGVAAPSWLYRSNVDANVYLGIVRLGRILVAAARGSFNLPDWLRDLWAWPKEPKGRPELGLIHAGMYGGTPEAWDIVAHYLETDDLLLIGGHSLGASRAGYLAGHALANGIDRRRIQTLCWGEPKWCTSVTRTFMAGIDGVSYVNAGADGHDQVTDEPKLEFAQRTALTSIDGGARGPEIDPFRRHHFDLYLPVTPATPIVFPALTAA